MRLDLQTDAPPRKQFHLITTAMTLHHVRDTDKVLAAFHQLLYPGGSLCIADLDSEPGTFHTGDEARSIPHHGFDRNELKNQLAAHGFAGLCDMTAFTIEKETENGQVRDFPVFLILARRPQ